MKYFRLIAAIALGLAVSACGTVDTATRNVSLEEPNLAPAQVSFDVQYVRVSVPETLKVSEANRFLPGGDIVWREDAPGNRHAQVKTIVEAGILQGIREMEAAGIPVILDIEVTRFHALTEKARYTVGGVHAIQFNMQLRNVETGQPYGEPQFVKADFKALGGKAAIHAESKGMTQKYRITQQLAWVIQKQLTDPEGYQAANLGIIGALNQI